MDFSEFAKKTFSVLGGGSSTTGFTRALFDAIVVENGREFIEKGDSTFKNYFNGKIGITGIAKSVCVYCDPAEFIDYISEFPEGTIQNLADAFSEDIPDITPFNAAEKLADLFMKIIREAAGTTRNMARGTEPVDLDPCETAEEEESDPYAEFLCGIREEYTLVKTILYQERLVPFYEIYICNDVTVYRPLRNGASRIGYGTTETEVKDITAEKLTELTHYAILRGNGGIGKSMMMRHLLFTAIDEYPERGVIPVIVPLKSYNSEDIDLLDFIVQTIRQFDRHIAPEQIISDLERGRFMLLMDGLDEIASKYMLKFEASIGMFVNQYRKNYFVISSRPISDFVSYGRFAIIELQTLKKDQAIALIDKLDFRSDDPGVKQKFTEALKERLYDTHRSFASNPLLLNIMLLTFESYADVPSKMHKFYEEAYGVLAARHDATKTAFRRAFETGFDSYQFADYLAEFSARTYMAEEYKIPARKARDHYYEMNVRERYADDRKNFAQFMRDICNNLCLMYLEREEYNFMHRSFQEYFCALYFSKLRDGDLKHLGEVLECRGRYKSADRVFDMLYDMIPEKVEDLIILPRLRQLFSHVDGYNGYWSFLIHVYPEISYAVGKTSESDPDNEPNSFIYRFVAEHIGALHHNKFGEFGTSFPGYEYFDHLDFVRRVLVDEDGYEEIDVAPVYDLAEDFNPEKHEICGSIYSFLIVDLRDHRNEEDEDIPETLDPYNPRNYPEEVGEVIEKLDSKSFPLRVEYENVHNYYVSLEEMSVRRAKRKNFF